MLDQVRLESLMHRRLRHKTKIHNARVKCAIEYYVAAMQCFAYTVSHVPTYLHPPTRHLRTLTFYVNRIVRQRIRHEKKLPEWIRPFSSLLSINNYILGLETTNTCVFLYVLYFLRNFLLRRWNIFCRYWRCKKNDPLFIKIAMWKIIFYILYIL